MRCHNYGIFQRAGNSSFSCLPLIIEVAVVQEYDTCFVSCSWNSILTRSFAILHPVESNLKEVYCLPLVDNA